LSIPVTNYTIDAASAIVLDNWWFQWHW